MAYNLGTAFMDFTSGVIEADKKNTKENLIIRGKELDAKRDSLIRMKEKKYDRELLRYDEDKKRIDALTSMKASFANNSIDAATYGKKFVMETKGAAEVKAIMDTFKTQKERDDYFATIGNSDPLKNDAVFKRFKTESVIDSNYQDAINNINDRYSTALKAAKNDSSLVNALLGKKNEEIKNLSLDEDKSRKDIATIDAADSTINYIEKNEKKKLDIIQDDISGEVEEVDATGYTITNEPKVYEFRPSKDWRNAYKDAFGNTKYDLKGTQVFSYLNTLGVHGGNDELSLKFNKTDSGIDGHNANSSAQIDFMKTMFNQVKDSKTVGVVGAITGPDNFEEVGTVLNTDKVLSEMTSILDQNRSGNIKEDIKIGWGGDIRLTTFVPLNVADTKGNLIIKGIKVGNLNEAQMGTVNGLLNNFIVEQAKLNPRKDIDAEGKAVGVYRKLYKNQDAAMLNSFNEYMLANNKDLKASYEKALTASKDTEKKTTDETTTTDGVDTSTKFKISTTKDGSAGVEINGKVYKIKDNLEYLKTIPNTDLQKAISDATKFGMNVNKMAPLVGIPKKSKKINKKKIR